MAKKDQGNQPKMVTETAAADSLATHPNESSRAATMLNIMNLFQSMDADKMTEALATMQNLSAPADGMASKNAASIQTKGDAKTVVTQAMKEDMDQLFGSMELSEDFRTKMTTIFEATVGARMIAETARLEEEFAKKLEEQTTEIVGQLVEDVDKYVTMVAEEWITENKVAIDGSLRAEIAEDFIGGLHKLFAEHFITVPENKIDVVEGLADEIAELKAALNEKTDTILQMSEVLGHYAKDEVFAEVAEGLALTQRDKLKKLAEGVEFTGDVDEYKSKIAVLKEHTFSVKPTKQSFEETSNEPASLNEEVKYADPSIKSFYDAISRTTPKR